MKERKKSAISKILEPSALRRMAGARSFERGEGYFAAGRVGPLVEYEGKITAKVQGTRAYRVSLWEEDGELEYSCTCPVGADAAFCKHCVALGLAWLEEGRKAQGKKPLKKAVTMEDVRGYLAGQDKKVLVELLMEQAVEDDRLRQRLLLKAAKKGPRGPSIATYRQAIDEAVDVGGFVDYHEAHDHGQRIEEAVDSIEELLKEGHAAEVIELTEHALGLSSRIDRRGERRE